MEETMTIEELERRVRMLEDMEEIKELHREYLFWISGLEIEKALDCFANDIEVEVANYGIRKGKDEVGRFFREIIGPNVLRQRTVISPANLSLRSRGKSQGSLDVLSLCPRSVEKMDSGKI